MSYLYLLAGENLELAEAELEGFLKSQGLRGETSRTGRLVETGAEPDIGQLRRLALVHEAAELIEKRESLEGLEYRPEGSFSVRAESVENDEGTAGVEEETGSRLETPENKVDLDNPDERLRVYVSGGEYFLARLVEDIDRGLFRKRSNEERPFSSPVSLDPVIARVLVNLSGVPPGKHVLDPFCGTGGILIEAGLCGVGVHGLDVQKKMVEGTRKNLEEYGIISHDIRQREVAEAAEEFDRKFESVVTDLPYGEASKIEGRPLEEFMETAPELVENRLVFMSDQESLQGMEPEFEIYVHKNLTRYIYVIEN